MTQFSPSSLLLPVLQQVSLDRLQKAVTALVDGSVTITLTRQTEADIRALVRNGEGAEYGVTLTESLTACSCKDALYRGGICKHAVAVSLFVLRTPTPQRAVDAPVVAVPVEVPTLPVVASSPGPTEATRACLCWSDGFTVCGSFPSNRVHRYPWNPVVLERACPDCLRIYHAGYNNHMIHVMSHKNAA